MEYFRNIFDQHLNRFYTHQFLRNLVSSSGSYFAMSYFFFRGYTATDIVANILLYGLVCLLLIYPINKIMGVWGVKRTFLLHIIPTIVTFFIVISISSSTKTLFYSWMVIHAMSVMFRRIPLNAYFSFHGENTRRGSQLGVTKIIETFASIAVPVAFGALVDSTGLIVIMAIKTFVFVIAGAVLGLRDDQKIELEDNPFTLNSRTPGRITKAFFLSSLTYPFANDLFFLWIVLTFGSFTKAGGFVSAKVFLLVALSVLVGKLTDAGRIRHAFIMTVIVLTALWLALPLITSVSLLIVFQFLIAIGGVVVMIPVEREYHNEAKSSGREAQYALWREITIQGGIVLGCILCLVLMSFFDWQTLIPLGSLTVLPLLYIAPQRI